MEMNVKLYQIYYKKEQLRHLDKDLIPYDNTKNENPEFAEYGVFFENYRRAKHKEADYVGFLSWKFCDKTRIGVKTFIDFIKRNPGYDVYFINPSPDNVDLFHNVWHHGEKYHPGILDFTQKIMDCLKYDINLKEYRNTDKNTLYCNYWVGNEFFWDQYMKFTMPIYNYINAHFTPEERKEQGLRHTWAQYQGYTYSPFIFEKLFSTLLVYNPNIKALNYEYPEECKRLIAEINSLYEAIHDIQVEHGEIVSAIKRLNRYPRLWKLLSLTFRMMNRIYFLFKG